MSSKSVANQSSTVLLLVSEFVHVSRLQYPCTGPMMLIYHLSCIKVLSLRNEIRKSIKKNIKLTFQNS